MRCIGSPNLGNMTNGKKLQGTRKSSRRITWVPEQRRASLDQTASANIAF